MYWNSFCLLAVVLLATGAAQPQPPRKYQMPNNPCTECVILADRAIEYFTTFKFFKQFQKENIPKPWKAAGIRSCDEFVWAYQCFQHCKNDLEVGVSYSYPKQYKHLEVVISKYCESEWPVDGAVSQCRMADTRACDMLHNKQSCGHHLTDYVNCIDNVLKESGLDCSGVCTPARRFHKTAIFQWEMECELRKSAVGLCGDYVNLFCFGEMKDSDINWGYFYELNEDARSQNLEDFCPKMEAPLECLQATVDTWLLYFGFNLTRPCDSVRNQVQTIKEKWSNIIHPLCDGRPNGTVYIQDLCGSKPTTERMPSTTTTLAPPTTPLKTLRRKIKKKRVKITSGVAITLPSFTSLTVVFTSVYLLR